MSNDRNPHRSSKQDVRRSERDWSSEVCEVLELSDDDSMALVRQSQVKEPDDPFVARLPNSVPASVGDEVVVDYASSGMPYVSTSLDNSVKTPTTYVQDTRPSDGSKGDVWIDKQYELGDVAWNQDYSLSQGATTAVPLDVIAADADAMYGAYDNENTSSGFNVVVRLDATDGSTDWFVELEGPVAAVVVDTTHVYASITGNSAGIWKFDKTDGSGSKVEDGDDVGKSITESGDYIYTIQNAGSNDRLQRRPKSDIATVDWSYDMGTDANSEVIADGADVFAFGDDTLHSVDESTGSKNWSFTTSDTSFRDWYDVDSDNVYIGTSQASGGAIMAIARSDGTQQWKRSVGDPSEFVIADSGSVYNVNDGGGAIDETEIQRRSTSDGSIQEFHKPERTRFSTSAAPAINGVDGAIDSDNLYVMYTWGVRAHDRTDLSESWRVEDYVRISGVTTIAHNTNSVFYGTYKGFTGVNKQVGENKSDVYHHDGDKWNLS